MSKEERKGKLRLIAAIAMAMFSCFTFCCVTFAWFASIRTADTSGTGFITTKLPNVITSVEFHTMTDDEYVYNSDPTLAYDINGNDGSITYTKGDSSTSVEIGTYSTYGSKKSLLVLFNLREDASSDEYNFTLKAITTMSDFSTTILGSNGTIDQNNNSISDVIQFYSTSFTSSVSYDFTGNKDDIENKSQTFISIDDKNNASLANSSLALIDNTSKVKSIGVIISYNSTALELIYTKYIGNKVLEEGNIYFKTIDFKLSA